jgi:putative NADH-flavin reductase
MKLAVLGGSGRTGRHIVQQALEAGHQVRALVRRPEAFTPTSIHLEVLRGDATDPEAVRTLVEGCDVVVSALGPSPTRPDVCSTAAEQVIAAGARRYVAISGAALDVPGDGKDLGGKVVSFLVRTLTPAVFHDKVREHALLAGSSVGWTLVRPPRLTEGPGTGQPRSSLVRVLGTSVSRIDLATFTLKCAYDATWVGKAPFVSS